AHHDAADEHPAVADHALALEQVGNIARPEAARDIDGLVLFERSRHLETLLADRKRESGHHRRQEDESEQGAPRNDERVARAPRRPDKLWHAFGLQCGAGTAQRKTL